MVGPEIFIRPKSEKNLPNFVELTRKNTGTALDIVYVDLVFMEPRDKLSVLR